MTEPHEELLEIAERQDALVAAVDAPEIEKPLAALETAAESAGKASSGSWLGYHASIYYRDLQTPPPGAHFSVEWGGMHTGFSRGTTGDWVEMPADAVKAHIELLAGKPRLDAAERLASRSKLAFAADHAEVLSVLTTELRDDADPYLDSLKQEVEKIEWLSEQQIVPILSPQGSLMTRDSLAAGQGYRVPPHAEIIARVIALRQGKSVCSHLAASARKAGSHLARKAKQRRKIQVVGTNIFIGHGNSKIWKELKDFVHERLRLPWDEFNRVPVAGVANTARLSEMLDAAAIAFLIMTGEDQAADGTLRARMNVIHEAGLFQGRLGFGRAIVLLEDGCDEFSNIQGLGQIRFPKGNIADAFEEIRRVLEREGIID